MNKIKRISLSIFLALLGIGIFLLGAWDMQHAQAARPDVWMQADNIPTPLAGNVTQCPDQPNYFYLVAGLANGFDSDSLYLYNAVLDTWTPLEPLPEPRIGVNVACYQGKIYAAGGGHNGTQTTLNIYDIASDSWTSGASLPQANWLGALGAWDGKLYLVGGTPMGVIPYTPVNRVDVYDIATNTWAGVSAAPMPIAVSAFGAAQRGPYLYAVGGILQDPEQIMSYTQRYNMVNDTWDIVENFPSSQNIYPVASTAFHLYTLGGNLNPIAYDFNFTDLVETLDLTQWPDKQWTDLGDPLPWERANWATSPCTTAKSGGEIWSVGGSFVDPYGNLIITDTNYYRPTGESCFDFYFGDLPREEWELGNHPGDTTHYVIPLINDGTLTDTYDILASGVWTITLPSTVGPLGPGTTDLLMVEVVVPEGANPGDFDTAVVTVTSQGDSNVSDSSVLTTSVTEWQEAANVPIDVAFQSNAQCPEDPNGFYILGGSTPELEAIDEVYRFDASTNTWALETHLPMGGGWGHIATCFDNKLYVAGSGFSRRLDVYDIGTHTWKFLGYTPRDTFTAAMGTWDGELFIVGGTEEVNIYNIADNSWSFGPSMPVVPWGFGSVQAGPYLYVVGGFSGDWNYWNDNLDITLRLNMATREWEIGPAFTSRRAITELTITESHLYAIGGDVNGMERLDPTGLVETLDLSEWPNGTWIILNQPLPWALEANWGGFCTEAMAGGEIWSVGGASGTWAKVITIDDNYYLPVSEPCVSYNVDLPEPWQGVGEAGSTVEYLVTITNTGVVTDYYTMDVSTTWNIITPEDGPGPIGPGESMQIAIAVEVPGNAMRGDLGVTEISVVSISNPAAFDTTAITTRVLGYEFDFQSIPPDSQEGHPGDELTYALVVSNIGDFEDSYSVTISATWDTVAPFTIGPLQPGEDGELAVEVTIPQDALAGDWDFPILTLTSQADPRVFHLVKLTSIAIWYQTLLPLTFKN